LLQGGATPLRLGANALDRGGSVLDGADWLRVLLEEVYEALSKTDPAALRAELVQVAAVAAAPSGPTPT